MLIHKKQKKKILNFSSQNVFFLSKIDESNITTMNLLHDLSWFRISWRFISFEVQKWGMHYFWIKSKPIGKVRYFFYSTIMQMLCTAKCFKLLAKENLISALCTSLADFVFHSHIWVEMYCGLYLILIHHWIK